MVGTGKYGKWRHQSHLRNRHSTGHRLGLASTASTNPGKALTHISVSRGLVGLDMLVSGAAGAWSINHIAASPAI